MPKPILPKADRAIIASHEAGMHDRKPKPETCRDCAAEAKFEAVGREAIAKAPEPIKAVARRTRVSKALSGATVITVEPEPRTYKASVARGKAIMEGYTGPADGIVGDDDTRDEPEPKVAKPRAGDARRAMDARRIAAKAKPVEVPPYVEVEPGVHVPKDMIRPEVLAVIEDVEAKVAKALPKPKSKPVVIAKPPEASILGAIEVPADGFRTREEWMLAAVEAFRPWFRDEGETLPPVRISIGWPGGRGPKTGVLGQCYAASAVEDAVPAIFVTPSQKDPVEVLETILHECIHAAGHMHHRQPFQKVARKFGFVNGGKIKTSAKESPDLYATLGEMAAALGAFPHSAVSGGNGADPKAPPVQSTRMLKVWCESDGYTLRATAKWLKVAVPACPVCEDVMTVDWRDK